MAEIHKRENIVVRIDPDLRELIPNYLQNPARDIDAIFQALGNGDFESIRILGHGMKGGGGGYGFDPITQIGRAMETAAKEGDAAEIWRRGEELRRYLERVEIVYEQQRISGTRFARLQGSRTPCPRFGSVIAYRSRRLSTDDGLFSAMR